MSVKVRSNTLQPGRPDENQKVRLLLRSGRERVQMKRWWNSGGTNKNYIDCSAVKLSGNGGCEYLIVWPHNYDTRLDITWAAHSGTITFTMFRRATHAALMCMDGTVLTHWVFGKSPGVKPRPFHINDSCPDGCTPGSGGGGGSCTSDNDCPPGWICVDGTCEPPPTLLCQIDSDCPPGYVCIDGKCVELPNCSVDADCPDGFICIGGQCVPDPGADDSCWNIPKLPTIDSSEPVAPKSTELFTVCTDIPNLPDLQ